MNTIDISALPPPSVVQMPQFRVLKQQRLAELQGLDPTFNALVESDPAMKLLEILVYREMLAVARTNASVWAVLLAYSWGSNLDQLGENYDVYRKVIVPADDTTIPPTEAVMESDDAFRRRIRLSWYARNTAGAIEAYEFYALDVDGVQDAIAYGPQEWPESVSPGEVHVYVLSRDGDGTPSADLLQAVYDALSPDDIRPLTDYVSVLAPTIVPYEVTATLYIADGPDADVVVEAATKAMQRYADSVHAIGKLVSISGIYRALKQPGVDDVELDSPTANIDIANDEVSYCTGINLTVVRTSYGLSDSASS
ncbi:baseplate J/gp47 family protein [Klebsiella aerogenes]|uniref:baseplate assembly protein n=1 Tax=Klebsiella aerogenes TaxID=548 RepID=UPI002E374564|nr:baseplate J/gp47 family protein [Klebsiella aerogenes]